MKYKSNIFWFRRDLRLEDNVGLLAALKEQNPVLPVFIFDTEILEKLPRDDARVNFIHDNLQKMRKTLHEEYNSSLALFHGNPLGVFSEIIKKYDIEKVFTNHDYEPYAMERDNQVKEYLSKENISFHTFKDQVIFEKNEVIKKDGEPYLVYTPYMNTWKKNFRSSELKDHNTAPYLKNLVQNTRLPNLRMQDIGFKTAKIQVPEYNISSQLISNYEKTRNFPAKEGTSRLGPHLRFGTLSIRKAFQKADFEKNKTFLNELIWREFFMQILYHFPNTVTESFKKEYDRIEWRNNPEEFEIWKTGKTGFPLVDAGMRQLNQTGFMHNRVRMLTGSFLCKHLLIDWRWGEAYFAEKLLDYEMSSNIGNWQWVAGSGVDAAPYFRIFNPTTQIEKFDKNREYIKKWVKEFGTEEYPEPIVDHKEARERALKVYKTAIFI